MCPCWSRQRNRWVEAVNWFHQVKGCTKDVFIRTSGNQSRMRNVGRRQRTKNPRLPAHGFAAISDRVRGGPAEYERAATPRKAQQDILRTTGQHFDIIDGAAAQSLAVHPRRKTRKIHQLAPIERPGAQFDLRPSVGVRRAITALPLASPIASVTAWFTTTYLRSRPPARSAGAGTWHGDARPTRTARRSSTHV